MELGSPQKREYLTRRFEEASRFIYTAAPCDTGMPVN